jgi:hypothetical protein
MNKLGRYIEKVSVEDATTTDVEIKETQGVGSEPEEIKDIEADCLVDAEPEHDIEKSQIIELTDIKHSLEQYSELLRASADRGGLRAGEAALLAAGVNFCRKRAGITGVGEGVSVEDFGSVPNARATKVSLEAIDIDVKAVMAKIAEVIKKLIERGKAMIVEFDLQSTKVGQIAQAAKDGLNKWRTGELTIDTSLSVVITKDDLKSQGLAGLKETSVWVGGLLGAFETQVSATMKVFMGVVADPKSADLATYKADIRAIWAEGSPLRTMIKGDTHKFSGSLSWELVHKPNSTSAVMAYMPDLKTDYDHTNRQTITMNKAEFKALVDTTFTMNLQTRKNSQAYTAAMAHVKSLSDVVGKAGEHQILFALRSDIMDITDMLNTDIAEAIRVSVRIRNALGRFILGVGQEFDKSQGTRDVGSDANAVT